MNDKIKMSPALRHCREHRIEALLRAHIGLEHKIAIEAMRQRLHAFTQSRALVGEGELGAVLTQGFSDAPRDRALIGYAHDHALFARH